MRFEFDETTKLKTKNNIHKFLPDWSINDELWTATAAMRFRFTIRSLVRNNVTTATAAAVVVAVVAAVVDSVTVISVRVHWLCRWRRIDVRSWCVFCHWRIRDVRIVVFIILLVANWFRCGANFIGRNTRLRIIYSDIWRFTLCCGSGNRWEFCAFIFLFRLWFCAVVCRQFCFCCLRYVTLLIPEKGKNIQENHKKNLSFFCSRSMKTIFLFILNFHFVDLFLSFESWQIHVYFSLLSTNLEWFYCRFDNRKFVDFRQKYFCDVNEVCQLKRWTKSKSIWNGLVEVNWSKFIRHERKRTRDAANGKTSTNETIRSQTLFISHVEVMKAKQAKRWICAVKALVKIKASICDVAAVDNGRQKEYIKSN